MRGSVFSVVWHHRAAPLITMNGLVASRNNSTSVKRIAVGPARTIISDLLDDELARLLSIFVGALCRCDTQCVR